MQCSISHYFPHIFRSPRQFAIVFINPRIVAIVTFLPRAILCSGSSQLSKLFWLWLRNAFSAFCSAVVLGLMSKLLCASAPEYIFDEGLGQRVKPNLRLYYQVQCSTGIGSLPWSHGSLDSCKSTYLEWKRIFVGVLMEYNSFQLHCTWTPLLT